MAHSEVSSDISDGAAACGSAPIASLAFYGECTVCGRHRPDQQQLRCLYCFSQTHRGCAEAALQMTAQIAGELGWDRLTSTAAAAGEAAAARLPPPSSTAAGPTHRSSHSHGSPLKGTLMTFFCSPSCALCVAVYPNPNFDESLSELVEREASELWERMRAASGLAPWAGGLPWCPSGPLRGKRHREVPVDSSGDSGSADDDGSGAKTISLLSDRDTRELNHPACNGAGSSTSVKKGGAGRGGSATSTGLALSERAVYLQIRFDAWCRYFTSERAACGWAPPMLPPAHLAIHEDIVEQVNDLLTATGQAECLYMCTAPVGSFVALPHDGVWRGAKPIHRGGTNNYLAEAIDKIHQTAVEPHTTVAANLLSRGHTRAARASTGATELIAPQG